MINTKLQDLSCSKPETTLTNDDKERGFWIEKKGFDHDRNNPGYCACSLGPVSYTHLDAITKYSGNSYWTAALFTNDAGVVEYNMNTKPLSVTGKRTYVRSSAQT